MSEQSRGWLKGCAMGCGVLAFGVVLVPVIVSLRTCVPLRSAGQERTRLDERFGPAESFVPAHDGAIAAERMRAFLEVRRSLAVICERLEAVQSQMFRVKDLEKDAPSGKEVVGAITGLGRAAVDITPLIGEFFEQRNRALVAAEMGLGEYTYIFALAYRNRFHDGSIEQELFSEGGAVSPDAREVLRSILSHQRAALAGSGGADAMRLLVEQEIGAMQQDGQRLPWQDGAPRVVEESLAPFRAGLDTTFCAVTAGIEMDRDSGRALEIALE